MKRNKNEHASSDGTYVVKKNKKMNIGALIVCVLIAVAIWIYAKNADEKEKLENSAAIKDAVADEVDKTKGESSAETDLVAYASDCKSYVG